MHPFYMKTYRFIGLFIGLLAGAGGGFVPKAMAQVELVPNSIQGTVRFSNVNPDILALLNPPGNEGMSYLYMYASSLPPATRSASTDYLTPSTRTDSVYEIAVDSDAAGISYVVTPRISLRGDNQTYYFRNGTSPPVVASLPAPTLDFTECLGVLTVRFVDPAGAPLSVDGGGLVANNLDGSGEMTRLYAIPAGTTEQRIYLHGDTPAELIITVQRGASTYTDRIQYTAMAGATVPCDEFATLDIMVPNASALGQATGTVDMRREFELTVDGYDASDSPDTTSVVARYGPFGNARYAAVPGVNFTTPSSGAFTLANLAPTALDPASVGYSVWAEMYFRTNQALESFRTPALGMGANPPLEVLPGGSVDLGNLFVIDPGYLQGGVLLQGPAESLGHASLLRGLAFASDYDTDGDGLPDALGIYGVYYSTVAATGVDRAAPGATFTASFGYGYTGFKGSFNPATSAYEGQYELALGGLNSEPSLWSRNYLNVTAFSGAIDNDNDYYYYNFSITDTAAPETEITPTQPTTSDIAYCLSEVCITFRSTEPFYSPNIRFSYGGFTNIDFQGNPASYSVYLDPAYGIPIAQDKAATNGQVVMYLPQGSYHLTPYITPSNSVAATVSGDAIDLTVGCGERICVAPRLQVTLAASACADRAHITGAAPSSGDDVDYITYQLNQDPVQTLCTACGSNPTFAFDLGLPGAENTLVVTAFNSVSGGRERSNAKVGLPPQAVHKVCTGSWFNW